MNVYQRILPSATELAHILRYVIVHLVPGQILADLLLLIRAHVPAVLSLVCLEEYRARQRVIGSAIGMYDIRLNHPALLASIPPVFYYC